MRRMRNIFCYLGKWPRPAPPRIACTFAWELNILYATKLAAQHIKKSVQLPQFVATRWRTKKRRKRMRSTLTVSSCQQFALCNCNSWKCRKFCQFMPRATCHLPQATCHLAHCIFIFHLNCNLNAILCALLPALLPALLSSLLLGPSSRIAASARGTIWKLAEIRGKKSCYKEVSFVTDSLIINFILLWSYSFDSFAYKVAQLISSCF